MDTIITILGFLGVWGLFSFPLYQSFLELSSYAIKFSQISHSFIQLKKISPWYWVWPPLKIRKEKQRFLHILKAMNLDRAELEKIWVFLDKSTAWFYVSLAGLFNAIYFTYDLRKELNAPLSIFFLCILFMSFLSIGNVVYRMSRKRINQKIDKITSYKD